MRGLDALFDIPPAPKPEPKPKRDLQDEAIQLLKEEIAGLEAEVTALRLHLLQRDKRLARVERTARAAEVDAAVLLEAVSEFARVVTNDTRSGREVRERVRKLLEANKVTPPSTLGSSRKRGKKGSGTTETP